MLRGELSYREIQRLYHFWVATVSDESPPGLLTVEEKSNSDHAVAELFRSVYVSEEVVYAGLLCLKRAVSSGKPSAGECASLLQQKLALMQESSQCVRAAQRLVDFYYQTLAEEKGPSSPAKIELLGQDFCSTMEPFAPMEIDSGIPVTIPILQEGFDDIKAIVLRSSCSSEY